MANAAPRFLASRCPSCGAAKSRPAATAYVYCDFCGALADYDFRKACEVPRQMPGPAYQKLQAQLAPQLAAALAAGDRSGYRALQRRLYDAWAQACPNAVPVRCGDPAYRQAYVEHLAAGGEFAAFDDRAIALGAATERATAALKWIPRGNGVRVDTGTFAALLAAVLAQLDYLQSAAVAASLPPPADGAPAHLQQRMTHAMFVQGWLPYLDEKSARDLLARTGLAQEYVTVEPVTGAAATCGHCKAAVVVLAGARRTVCEGCGHRLSVDRRIDCDGCGHDFVLDDGSDAAACPYCRRRIERIGIPQPPLPSARG